jgi:asparagine synthase (glutamine-hydrolysing)
MALKDIFKKFFQSESEFNLKSDALIKEIHRQNLTYLPTNRMQSIAKTIFEIRKNKLPGIIIEAGCALGGSSILMASLKEKKRPLKIYDVFGMIPPPSSRDTTDVFDRYKIIAAGKSKGIGGNKYYGYRENLMQEVKDNFNRFGIIPEKNNVEFIKGMIQKTLIIKEKVVFAHIDVDWYDPVLFSLQNIFPNLCVGGSIIIDDYNDWGGCKKATDQYLQTIENHFTLDDDAGSLKITKTKDLPKD